MATIELYKDKINSMSNYIEQAKTAVSDFCVDLSALKSKILGINSSVCDSIVSKISSSSQTQEQQISGLETTQREVNDFIDLTINRDNAVSSAVAKAKDEFYKEYEYLKPDSEKSDWEKFCDKLEDVGEWCKDHWKEIVITIAIIVGAVLAIVAVVATGGMALVPILTSAITAVGVSAGTAMTVATITSLTIATIAVMSTLGSSTLNIMDTWCNIDNPVFNSWQTALNITSFISNGFYSIGGIYNGIKGISNANLRNYGKEWIINSRFRAAISGASNYNFNLKPNTSTFWSGIGDKGMGNGDQIAANCADKMGRTTLESTLSSNCIELPNWDMSNPASINAWNSAHLRLRCILLVMLVRC